ncbi:YbaK/prolyl-tRNA synthetase associated region [Candidatus Sulfobium mesophilum]|uniref:YbaK/prolyl-tRNA synthetase associated region n=1 Tax=Candidatus Sulfobium mesophilum TaxID=2016548 RepID=A0A2U3QKG4_9BACT|nr:YbaK/prolyl-tRNA synthetase associated region [Candidatus Sulfobium mesophilum]
MPLKKLKDYLESEKVKYESLAHYETYTSQETAQSARVPGRELAKTVIVKIDGKMAMAVLPASKKIDFNLLKSAAGGTVELAAEQEFESIFPDCEVGAMPPFGNLYGMEVYVDEGLAQDEKIAFNACSHIELIKLSYKDFSRLAKPKVIRLTS